MSYSVNQIKKAGKILITKPNNEEALKILSFWRSTHEKPLNYACTFVEKYSKRISKNYIIAHRLKRTNSIIKKLKRFNAEGMQLTTMQDIGGCRVILDNINNVNRLVNSLDHSEYFELRNNYIECPKEDGYRSVHLKGNFIVNNIKRQIELQVRTKIQHSWATAVEIVDLFTKQYLKHNQGDEKWRIFFKESSIVLSYFEKCFPDDFDILASDKKKLDRKTLKKIDKNFNPIISKALDNVYDYARTLNIARQFKAFASSLVKTSDIINTNKFTNEYLLLHIFENNENKFQLNYKIFRKSEYISAEEEYIYLEKSTINSKTDTVALISTNNIEDIQEAYPNYFADSTIFSNFVEIMVDIAEAYKKKNSKENVKLNVLSVETHNLG